MISGDAMKRDAPSSGSGALQLDPSKGDIQAVQWTCPTSGDVDRYPPDSDGSTAGIADPNNKGAGAGFPVVNCDGTYSPLRQDIHSKSTPTMLSFLAGVFCPFPSPFPSPTIIVSDFLPTVPSCYNPEAGLDDYRNNTAFPITGADGMQDCPEGWTHVPHLFYEVYYDTAQFADQWTPDGQTQPFVLANGDRTGFSSHADFVAGWDEATLQTIIDSCNAGTLGMETCADIPGGLNTETCPIEAAFPNPTDEWIDALPGDNPLAGWGV